MTNAFQSILAVLPAACWLLVGGWPATPAAEVPRSVEALWADFDPRGEPLDVQVVRKWRREGVTFRYVLYRVGTFKGVPARMAAFYAFPTGKSGLPGLLHCHGGGQRASLAEVEFYARRGYACLSINWGGRPMEGAAPDEPNTDWGAVDPTQQNVPGYFNLLPGPKYLDEVESPRNNNWYLLTVGARRGLTFLEDQPEVDPQKLGVYGHSMGANLTVYVAGTDPRVKVAAPSAGGQGFRTYPWKLLPEQQKHVPRGDVELFRATLGYQSYAPHVRCPLLYLGATNDFHGIMDDTYRTGELMQGEVRYAFTPHMNHRCTPEFAVTRPLWIDQHLQGTFRFPATPESELGLPPGGVPGLRVVPDGSRPVGEVRIYYSIGPDPQARFWRSASSERRGDAWHAALPIMSCEEPLFAFANVYYKLDRPAEVLYAPPTETFAISSRLHTAAPAELEAAGVRATDRPSPVIDDFSHGFRDWYRLSPDNPHHWQWWTRKVADPKWRGQAGYRLAVEVESREANPLAVVVTENFFRPYRGPARDHVAVVRLAGGDRPQTVELSPADFTPVDGGEPLVSWEQVDLLGFAAYYRAKDADPQTVYGTTHWAGPQPTLRQLRWQPGSGASN